MVLSFNNYVRLVNLFLTLVIMKFFWKEDWDKSRKNFIDWWEGKGLVITFFPPLKTNKQYEDIPEPPVPEDIKDRWTDPVYRARKAEYELSGTFFGGDAFPYFDTHIGPGNLATFLGSEPEFSDDTVWFKPVILNPERNPILKFNRHNFWFKKQMAIIEQGLKISRGRFLVGMPDLIQNIDILAALRGTENILTDMIDRPDFVKHKLKEINRVYFDAFDTIYEKIKDELDGNSYSAFHIWGPGKTAAVQCDSSVMFSTTMFRKFVLPSLTEQCQFLDYSLFHLDGSQGLHQLDAVLEIEELNAVEFTPEYGAPGGGDPQWFDLYKKILINGKSVQAVFVKPSDVIPLLDTVGSEGIFLMVQAQSVEEAEKLLENIEKFR